MADGTMKLCMLPVPAATSVLMQNQSTRQALDLTEEWDKVTTGSSMLTMGCLVVQADWAEENPDLLDTFLAEYAASIEYVNRQPGRRRRAYHPVRHHPQSRHRQGQPSPRPTWFALPVRT